MNDAINAELNRVLVRIHRGFLQYVGECWPWVGADEAGEQQQILELVEAQKRHVAQLAELLDARGWTIEFGTYPDWSEYHYCALDFLLELLIRDEKGIADEVEKAMSACAGDAEAEAILTAALATQTQAVSKLRSLTASGKAAPAMA